ncbi:DNA N-6-adenine-methyltransferase [Sphingobium sp. H39-3-25]|uniref:DNA N-6-adenine-methyltransferase n=1 Tax=Sphingobium arseniciresistens TaxID=3030834 RepID=UPI0023BA116C|nr:DNA N-6-adenine-methyltransferase [Sphingobium arseniciresistens]
MTTSIADIKERANNFAGFLMNLGDMVRTARKAVGLTQSEAAERAGVSARSLWSLEKNGGHMDTLAKVSAVIEFRIAGLPARGTLGERLRAARVKRGWSQAKLAEKVGLSIPTISSIENDRAQIGCLVKVLAVLAPQVRARKHEKAAWSGGTRDERFTPVSFLESIESAFGRISIDPCGHRSSNVRADRYLFIEDDGLSTKWSGRLAFVNPPYSAGTAWLERCHRAWKDGEVETVVCLIPARTHISAHFKFVHSIADTIFLKGRMQFDNAVKNGGFPMGLMLAIWGADDDQIAAMMALVDSALVPGNSRRTLKAA